MCVCVYRIAGVSERFELPTETESLGVETCIVSGCRSVVRKERI